MAASPDDDHHTVSNLPDNSVGPGFDDPGMTLPSDYIGSSSYNGATVHRYSDGVDPTSTYGSDNDVELASTQTGDDDTSIDLQQCLVIATIKQIHIQSFYYVIILRA